MRALADSGRALIRSLLGFAMLNHNTAACYTASLTQFSYGSHVEVVMVQLKYAFLFFVCTCHA